MRQYEAYWDRIKKKKKLVLELPPEMFPKVVKAIIKEKNQDLGFKILNTHDYFFLKIERKPAENRLVFTLKQRLGLEGVKGNE